MDGKREPEERPVLAVQEALYWLGDTIGRPGYTIVRLGERVADLGHTWSEWWCVRWERREAKRLEDDRRRRAYGGGVDA